MHCSKGRGVSERPGQSPCLLKGGPSHLRGQCPPTLTACRSRRTHPGRAWMRMEGSASAHRGVAAALRSNLRRAGIANCPRPGTGRGQFPVSLKPACAAADAARVPFAKFEEPGVPPLTDYPAKAQRPDNLRGPRVRGLVGIANRWRAVPYCRRVTLLLGALFGGLLNLTVGTWEARRAGRRADLLIARRQQILAGLPPDSLAAQQLSRQIEANGAGPSSRRARLRCSCRLHDPPFRARVGARRLSVRLPVGEAHEALRALEDQLVFAVPLGIGTRVVAGGAIEHRIETARRSQSGILRPTAL